MSSILEYLKNKNGVTSDDIAKEFLALKGDNSIINNMLVEKLLSKEPLTYKENSLWYVKETTAKLIRNEPFLVCVMQLSNDKKRILSLIINEVIADNSKQLFAFVATSVDELIEVRNSQKGSSIDEFIQQLYLILNNKRVVFTSLYEQRLLLSKFITNGFVLPEDTLTLFHLLKIIGTDVKRTTVIDSIKTVSSVEHLPTNITALSNMITTALGKIIEKLEARGVLTVEDLLAIELKELSVAHWSNAQFSIDDVIVLDEVPGVYGFKDRSNSFIYIGKGKNLKKRLLSYFRISEESPKKLEMLRDQAFEFVHFYCGNELEASLLEYRLIQKYQPKLNSKIEVSTVAPSLNGYEGIWILPSTKEGYFYTLWVNNRANIMTQEMCIGEEEKYREQIQLFFFSNNNFDTIGESIIAKRWLSPRVDFIDRIDFSNKKNIDEIVEFVGDILPICDGSGVIYR